MLKVFDIASTDQGAYRLLKSRVEKIDQYNNFENYIVCPQGEWYQKMIESGVKCIPFNVKREISFSDLLQEIKQMEDILIKYKPDIVHSHNSKTGVIARIAVKNVNKNKKLNIKMIHQVHGYHFTSLKGIKKNIYLLIEIFLSHFTDVLLFQNKYELSLSKKHNMDKKCDLVYIGNGINLEEFNQFYNEGIKTDEKKIVCVARIEPIKNHLLLLKALFILSEKYHRDDVKLVLIGEGDTSSLKEYITKHKIDHLVKFTGVLDRAEVIHHIQESYLSILTSFKEGKPRALIEAQILGKPCIATDVIGSNEVILNNETGFLVELNNEELLAEKINLLLEDKNLYNIFSSNAKGRAINEFNEDNVIKDIVRVYESISS